MHEPSRRVDELANRVIGAAIEVHRWLGPGHLESVYEQALLVELHVRGIPFVSQVTVPVVFKGVPVGETRLDVLVDEELIIEIKAVERLLPIHRAQVIAYLKATGHRLGLMINFNVELLKQGVHRVIWTPLP